MSRKTDKLGLTPCSMAGFLQNEGCTDDEFQLLDRLGERMLQKDYMLK